jgi:hypothetical protein
MTKFKYFGTWLTNHNCIREEIKNRLNSGNAYYLSVQNLLYFRLLSKNLKIKIYEAIILSAPLYGCGNSSVTLWEKHMLNVSENRALRRIFGPKREEVAGCWRRLHNEKFHNLYISPNIIRVIK